MCTIALFSLAQDASAQGFKIQESGPSHGNAGAGSAATADDPSTVFFNPAGMTGIEGNHGSVLIKWINGGIRYRDKGSQDLLGGAMQGGNGRNAAENKLFPSFFAVVDHSEDVRYGIGVNAPFGLATDYGDSWAGRYHATESSLVTININPAAAWRVNEQWSVGAGVNVQYLDVSLENAIDFGSIGVDELGAGPAGQLGLRPQRDDGSVEITGDSWGVGLNAGVLYELQPGTRFGLAWRSKVDHTLEGDADFRVPRDARRLTAAGAFRDTGAEADITIPTSVLLGVSHDVAPEWTLVGGFEWTDFSEFRQIKVEFDSPKQDPLIERQDWDDTTRTMAGVIWRPGDDWTFRFGAAYDSSPVDRSTRRPRLPDSSRATLAVGVGYKLNERTSIEFGYMRAWWASAKIDIDGDVAGRLRGDVRSTVNYFGLAVTFSF
ncbi:MAG: outer membrane protein transport protein [Planctomycetota bacterium]|nr:outer membrane protein transport protein [Planctomycetota bacterium]